MFSVTQDDVLRGLKKFRRLAKQDLLASRHTSDPAYWKTQAEARRSTYGIIMKHVQKDGVEKAYEKALQTYAALSLFHDKQKDPQLTGMEQAHEMFFTILGLTAQEISRLRHARRRRRFHDSHQAMLARAGR